MKHANLATTYRPQTFAEVAGQELIVKVLSRSVAQDKIAPAYLLSGTRGVGKTTIARIFAKALNCIHAPQAEPCNKCVQCRNITQGNHIDVREIDGASHTGVDDARALQENIGLSPMEGRYKVFIIDEAHMLSRSAFNAMLKTLEEPPPRVVFIFASTEAHKFPITIVSRCQHFVLKRLRESQIITHLTGILQKEQVSFEPEAVNLIAKRACGSVRDGMSLLGQSLALGDEILNAKSVRSILGMTSLDIYNKLIDAIIAQNCLEITKILGKMLDEGIDIGFFLREFTSLWRTLFLLRQDGNKIITSLNLPEDEASLWLAQAQHFSLTHIHAAWHMVLEAQKRISQSPEPRADLELLFLNISLMPKLLPLEKIKNSAEFYPQDTIINENSNPEYVKKKSEIEPDSNNILPEQDFNSNNLTDINTYEINDIAAHDMEDAAAMEDVATMEDTAHGMEDVAAIKDATAHGIKDAAAIKDVAAIKDATAHDMEDIAAMENAAHGMEDIAAHELFEAQANSNVPMQNEQNLAEQNTAPAQTIIESQDFNYMAENEQFISDNSLNENNSTPIQLNWEDLYKFLCQQDDVNIKKMILRQTKGRFDKNTLILETKSIMVYNALDKMKEHIKKLAESFFKQAMEISIQAPQNLPRTKNEMIAEAETYIEVKNLKEMFDACIEDCKPYETMQPNNKTEH